MSDRSDSSRADELLGRARVQADALHETAAALPPVLDDWCRYSAHVLVAELEVIRRQIGNIGRVHAQTVKSPQEPDAG